MHIYAEQTHEWEQFLYQLSELEDIESSSWESSFELLCDLEENPININTASREDLEQFPFLTAKDVENISEYIYRYGPMKSLGELVMIKICHIISVGFFFILLMLEMRIKRAFRLLKTS